MNTSAKHVIIVAGEASGDLHAAHLVHEIRKINSQISFSGLGGPRMKDAGVDVYEDLTKIAVVGFIEVAKYYKEFKRYFDFIIQKIKETKPDAVILVDYPGFNLRLAKAVKKLNVKVIYYISPQVWAWKANRVKLVKKYVDKMLVLFSFEKEFYAQRNVDVFFVGHPLIDIVKIQTPKEPFLRSVGFTSKALTIGLMPGSRQKEVEMHFPIMLESARRLSKEFSKVQYLIINAPTIDKSYLVKQIMDTPLSIKIVDQSSYDAINACDVCMVASGTATLELAILEKPMVIIYKTSLFTWLLAKFFLRIKNIGLVNILAGKEIVPECVQFKATAIDIVQELKNIITNEIKIVEIRSELNKVRSYLGETGASQRAAEEVLKTIS